MVDDNNAATCKLPYKQPVFVQFGTLREMTLTVGNNPQANRDCGGGLPNSCSNANDKTR